ncbi:hypothetical protein HOLDEFILI_02843 [Holdemania filiformis DSM 12042]|uniref:Uncharacterized protein n=1 Tax=Holdemania filiformis DSM 12042 TaxID=545696 RepID=B9YAI6_9FIRM|nr:hypothetical protein HOLDEFILI_02843 [Holdemania filiformis DSM 12042]
MRDLLRNPGSRIFPCFQRNKKMGTSASQSVSLQSFLIAADLVYKADEEDLASRYI